MGEEFSLAAIPSQALVGWADLSTVYTIGGRWNGSPGPSNLTYMSFVFFYCNAVSLKNGQPPRHQGFCSVLISTITYTLTQGLIGRKLSLPFSHWQQSLRWDCEDAESELFMYSAELMWESLPLCAGERFILWISCCRRVRATPETKLSIKWRRSGAGAVLMTA